MVIKCLLKLIKAVKPFEEMSTTNKQTMNEKLYVLLK